MRIQFGLIACLIILVLAGSTGVAAAAANDTQTGQAAAIAPYNGQIGPGNSLYGLKLAFENIDESFTFNQSERLEKQINHADIRLAELKHELIMNNTDTANIALEHYRLKMNQTEESLGLVLLNGTAPASLSGYGLEHAQEMIAKHQTVLEELLQTHPDNKGLERAYSNSVTLEEKFERRIENRQKDQQQVKQNRSLVSPDNQTPSGNQTFMNMGRGRGAEDNKTVQTEWDQSRDMNQFAGNTTRNIEQNLNGINQSAPDKHQQQGNGTPGNDQQGKSGQGNSAGNIGDNQNASEEKKQNPDITPTTMHPTGNGNSQNSGTSRNAVTGNGGDNTGNTRSPGR